VASSLPHAVFTASRIGFNQSPVRAARFGFQSFPNPEELTPPKILTRSWLAVAMFALDDRPIEVDMEGGAPATLMTTAGSQELAPPCIYEMDSGCLLSFNQMPSSKSLTSCS
jgi:hypothetical protein